MAKFKIEDHSDEVLNELENALEVALEEVGLTAEGYAKKLCPVDTGLLRNSITHAVGGNNTSISSYKGSSHHGDTPVTRKNKVAGKPAPEPHSGTYSGTAGSKRDHTVYIGTNVEYAPYVELGTVNTKAQLFLKPAIQDHVSQYIAMIKKRLQNN